MTTKGFNAVSSNNMTYACVGSTCFFINSRVKGYRHPRKYVGCRKHYQCIGCVKLSLRLGFSAIFSHIHSNGDCRRSQFQPLYLSPGHVASCFYCSLQLVFFFIGLKYGVFVRVKPNATMFIGKKIMSRFFHKHIRTIAFSFLAFSVSLSVLSHFELVHQHKFPKIGRTKRFLFIFRTVYVPYR
jgi:hypothetical protein